MLGLSMARRESFADVAPCPHLRPVACVIFSVWNSATATPGRFYWLGFETSGLSADKKRFAWLGARLSDSNPNSGDQLRTLGSGSNYGKSSLTKGLVGIAIHGLFAEVFRI